VMGLPAGAPLGLSMGLFFPRSAVTGILTIKIDPPSALHPLKICAYSAQLQSAAETHQPTSGAASTCERQLGPLPANDRATRSSGRSRSRMSPHSQGNATALQGKKHRTWREAGPHSKGNLTALRGK